MSDKDKPETAPVKKAPIADARKSTMTDSQKLAAEAKKMRAESNRSQLNFRLLKFPADISGRLTMLKTACVVMGTIVSHDRAMDMVEALKTMAAWVERKSVDNLRSHKERAEAALHAADVKRAADSEKARLAAVADAETAYKAAVAAKAAVGTATEAAEAAKANVSK